MNFTDLKGHTLQAVKQNGDEIYFTLANRDTYRLFHSQDCCETVEIESIVGDLADLVGSPILVAEESSSGEDPNTAIDVKVKNRLLGIEPYVSSESNTWTFYKLATIKGYVDIRFHGSSNGYYSESVSFERVE